MLAAREWIRFFRQPFRIIAALGQPILFWILFGTGLHSSFQGSGVGTDYMTYFLPGTVALIVLFTAIFATISIIEDRREGFLQGVLVAPNPRWSIVVGKSMGGGAIAWAQAVFFIGLACLTGSLQLTWQLVPLSAFLAVACLAITNLGVCFAWPMDSTQGFHAAMNLVLLPMWLLSGAFFPIPSSEAGQPIGQWILHWVMRFNPMSYVVGGIRHIAGLHHESSSYWKASQSSCWFVTLIFWIVTGIVATWIVTKQQKGELQ